MLSGDWIFRDQDIILFATSDLTTVPEIMDLHLILYPHQSFTDLVIAFSKFNVRWNAFIRPNNRILNISNTSLLRLYGFFLTGKGLSFLFIPFLHILEWLNRVDVFRFFCRLLELVVAGSVFLVWADSRCLGLYRLLVVFAFSLINRHFAILTTHILLKLLQILF